MLVHVQTIMWLENTSISARFEVILHIIELSFDTSCKQSHGINRLSTNGSDALI